MRIVDNQRGSNNLMYRHGLKGTRIYNIRRGMKQRCFSPTKESDKINYFDKGIVVCEDWMDITNFNSWAINNGYDDTLTIDRIDSNGNYEPSNCRWVTVQVNNRNRDFKKVKNKYIGVNMRKSGKFRSTVKVDSKEVYLGIFNTQEEALNARNEYIVKNKLLGFKIQEL